MNEDRRMKKSDRMREWDERLILDKGRVEPQSETSLAAPMEEGSCEDRKSFEGAKLKKMMDIKELRRREEKGNCENRKSFEGAKLNRIKNIEEKKKEKKKELRHED